MRILVWLLFLAFPVFGQQQVEVFVCLCDNKSQGIQPVPEKIGNGLDPTKNLYWGNSQGLAGHFQTSKKWKLLETKKPKEGPILVTVKFKHLKTGAKLTAHAYRGDKMHLCLQDFFKKSRESGKDELVAFIGHNGLMDTPIKFPQRAAKDDIASKSIVLGCLTSSHFTKPLALMNSKPLLLTKSLMYPGSFLLHDALEVWLRNGSKKEIREAAARAYARNQKISVKAARTIFAE